MSDELPARAAPPPVTIDDGAADDVKARARQALDVAARAIGRATVNHLKEMYPDALEAVTANAERSLTNFVRNRINSAVRPLFDRLIVVADHVQRLELEESELVSHLRRDVRDRDAEIRKLKLVIEELGGGG